ncbi:unnamed protein product [Polarella glacialis]|uniref:EF-hand domain-containing protein n=1 Tax=Polarella glacialis TaxID=89957 RepID=A0A813D5G7_POLGL|nr:unnamed protein product [Polarella glacialis]
MLKSCLSDNFGTVWVPQYAVIRNSRLGILLWLLKLGAALWIVYSIVASRSWNNIAKPMSFATELWQKSGDPVFKNRDDVPHCNDLARYAYNYSSNYHYQPASCRKMPPGEDYARRPGLEILYPTFFQDQSTRAFATADCGAGGAAEAFCTGEGGVMEVPGPGLAGCACTQSESYFAKNVESDGFFLSHGYLVKGMGYSGSHGQRARSRLPFVEETTEDDRSDRWQRKREEELLTIIKGTNGQDCQLQGRSRFYSQDAIDGIGGSLNEWLSCAGVTLDSQDERARSGHPGENMAPQARLTGMTLQLTLSYMNKHHGENHNGIVCFLRVESRQHWNSDNLVRYGSLPDKTGATSMRYSTRRGVSVVVQAEGAFSFFDSTSLNNAVVNAVVTFNLPDLIVALFAMSCLGVLSEIYSKTRCKEVEVKAQCQGSLTRMLVAAAVFKTFAASEKGVSSEQVFGLLDGIFRKHREDGVLDQKEISVLASHMMAALDPNGDQFADFDEFVKFFVSSEVISVHDMAQMYDIDRRRPFLERLFHDSSIGHRSELTAQVGKRLPRVTIDPKTVGSSLQESE